MKKFIGGFALVVVLLIACDKDESVTTSESFNLEGRYLGTFHRTGMDTAEVTILLRDSHFEGSSDTPKYPAICGGSFNVQGSMINFTDSCSWTADFDWSLILSGTFNLQINDGTVKIWRTNGAITDEYLLRKAVR